MPYTDLAEKMRVEPGDLVVVAARPAMGKSVVLMDIAQCAAIEHQLRVWVSSLEMSHANSGSGSWPQSPGQAWAC